MAFSSSKTTRLLVLLQITLLVVSALISVCHGARGIGSGTIGYGPLDPNRPACLHGQCPSGGGSYVHPGGGAYENNPGGGGEGGPIGYGPRSYPAKPASP